MVIIEDDAFFLSPETLTRIREHLEQGGLCIFPTETVYGIGCLYHSITALQKIYEWKGRSWSKPLALLFGTVHRAVEFLQPSHWAKKILFHLLPGPVTVLVKKHSSVTLPSYLISEGEKVGVRIPDHPLPLSIALLFRAPLALTSANISGEKEPVSAREVPTHSPFPDLLFLRTPHPTPLGKPTTVLSLHEEERVAEVVRRGAYEMEKLKERLQEVGVSLVE
ncbi:MAG: L-threonylcarbamoyladenylate synthase [bacterium JZ-2024 1]